MDTSDTGEPVVIFDAAYTDKIRTTVIDNGKGQMVVFIIGPGLNVRENTYGMDDWISSICYWQMNDDLDGSLNPSYCHSLVKCTREYVGEDRWTLAILECLT